MSRRQSIEERLNTLERHVKGLTDSIGGHWITVGRLEATAARARNFMDAYEARVKLDSERAEYLSAAKLLGVTTKQASELFEAFHA